MYNGGKNHGWFRPKVTNIDESALLKWLLWNEEFKIQMMNLAIDHVSWRHSEIFLGAFSSIIPVFFKHWLQVLMKVLKNNTLTNQTQEVYQT